MTRAYCAKHARTASVRHTSSFVAVVRTVANGHGASDSHTSATPLERPFLRGALSPAARDPHRSLWLPARERYASVLGRLARRRITSRAGWDTPRRERVALPHARLARGAVPAGGAAAPVIAADPVRAVRYARERRRGRRGGRSRSRRSGRRRRGGGCGGRRGWCARRPRAPRAVGVVDADVAMEEWHGGGAGVAWFRRQPRIPVPADHVRV